MNARTPSRSLRVAKSTSFIVALLTALASAKVTLADTGLGIPAGFNAFVEESFTASYTDVQGRLAAGQNLSLHGYGVATGISVTPETPVLVAGGDITFDNGQIYVGSVLAGGDTSGITDSVRSGMVAGSSITPYADLPFSFADEFAQLRNIALTLSKAQATGSVEYKWGGAYLTGDCTSEIQVFHLNGEMVKNASTFDVQCLPQGATVIFNLDSLTPGLTNMDLGHLQSRASKVLWNFYEATSVHFESIGVKGSILAPQAVLNTPWGHVDGSVMVKGWTGHMELHHVPFDGDIKPLLPSHAPVITSSPAVVATEDSPYTYAVEATDEDAGDVLTHTIDLSPLGFVIDAQTGLISWTPAAEYVGTVPDFNEQCYVVPTGSAGVVEAGDEIPDGRVTYISPLFKRVTESLEIAADYTAREAVAWDQRNGCLGCHIQTQSLLGLETSLEKVVVDEQSIAYLLNALVSNQQDNGTIVSVDHKTQHLNNQTSLALWALSSYPDRAATLDTRVRALDFFVQNPTTSGSHVYWPHDHATGWMNNAYPVTALVSQAGAYLLKDHLNPDVTFTDEQALVTHQFASLVPELVSFFIAGHNTPVADVTQSAFRLIGLSELRPHIVDADLLKATDQAITSLDAYLRSVALSDGGWAYSTGQATPSPVASAWVGSALNYLDPEVTDPIVTRNIEYLLSVQNLGASNYGTWTDGAVFPSTFLATTSIVMAYLPVALDFLGNPDLSIEHVGLVEQGDLLSLSAKVRNRGLTSTNTNGLVSFYAGANEQAPLIGTVDLPPVDSSESRSVSLSINDPSIIGTDIFVRVDVDSAVEECEIRNNMRRAAVVRHRVTDARGLFDTQIYALNVEDANSAPIITSAAAIVHHQGQLLGQRVSIEDVDVGDAAEFSLVGAPSGVFIEPRTGQIYVDNEFLEPGTYTFIVHVEDLRGGVAEQEVTFTVKENLPPQIISQPVAQKLEGDSYLYDVDATDPNGDELRYSLAGASAGFAIRNTSGEIFTGPDAPLESLRTANEFCQAEPIISQDISPKVKWEWSAANGPQPTSDQVMQTPIVIPLSDTNGDGAIDVLDEKAVVFMTFSGSNYSGPGFLRAISAKSGAHIWTAEGINAVLPEGSLAAADINGDGAPEIIAPLVGGGLVAVDNSGNELWRTEVLINVRWGGASISDLNADGVPEIIVGNTVFDNTGALKFQGVGPVGENATNIGALSFAADVDLDGIPEIVAGGSIYSAEGELLVNNGEGFAAVGNFDGDDFAEIAVVFNGAVSLYHHDGAVAWSGKLIPGGGKGGAPVVADMTGDGVPEIGVAGSKYYAVFNAAGELLWSKPISDESSNLTGSSVFDFNGDGRSEVVYADEFYLRVYDGPTGNVIYEVPNSSGTTYEYPLIVDLDDDEHAEIVVIGNNYAFPGFAGVRVFEDVDDQWVATRSIWNQHAYSISNINDDMTVPAVPGHSWLTHNTFRLNTFTDRSALAQPDLAPFELKYNDQTQTLSALILNRGAAPTNAAAEVVFYSGNPEDGGIGLGSIAIGTMAAGESQTVSLPGIAVTTLADDVFVGIRYTGSLAECITDNNRTSARLVTVSATDEGGLADTQAYLYSVVNENDWPEIGSAASSTTVAGEALSLQVEVVDIDQGDAHTFALLNAPEGVFINRRTGLVTANTSTFLPGVYDFTVQVTDLAGAQAEQVHTLNVIEPDNYTPVFTSTPPATTPALSELTYTTTAEDRDGDALAFGLSEKPFGVTIDGNTGLMTWSPTRSQVGTHTIAILVTDARGASATQRFSVSVTDPYANNQPPQITSAPSGAVTVGKLFEYRVIATDPDGDALSYKLEAGASGMMLNAQGLFTWRPDPSAIGRTFTAKIVVTDGRGGMATQTLALPVNEPANTPPVITSGPPLSAEVGKTYHYQLAAEDADGDSFVFTFGSARANGMTMDAGGLVTWVPSAEQANQVLPVDIQVTDARGAVGTQSFTVAVNRVVEPNELPYFISKPTSPAVIGEQYQYQAIAKDPDLDVLTYTLVSSPVSGLLVNDSGLLTWTPVSGQEGTYTIAIKVSDGKGAVTQSYQLAVDPARDLTNAYPEILSDPATEVVLGDSYTYQLVASDPDGDPLTFELLSDLADGMSFTPEGLLTWSPTSANIGVKDLQVKVSDGQLAVVQSWSIKVWEDVLPLRLFLDVSPVQVNEGETVTFTVNTTGGQGTVNKTLSVDGVAIQLDAAGTASIAATGFGLHNVQATAATAAENRSASDSFLVVNPADSTAPTAELLTPEYESDIYSPTVITGTANDDNLVEYSIFISPKGLGQWTRIAQGSTPVIAGALGTFDPTLLNNGIYDVVLEVLDVNGQKASDNTVVTVDGDMKVGHFSITFEDMSVDLAGIPIRVSRTYDTRQRAQDLDFGYGWSVDYQNVRLHESRKLGFSWNLNYHRTGFFGSYCVEPSGSPSVSITLPDGSVERFIAKANPECTSLVAQVYVEVGFEAMSGTYSTLEQLDYGVVRLVNGDLINLGDIGVVDPNSYRLTTKDGMVYYLDQNFGVRRIEEPGGNYVTYSSAGIQHSSGYAVSFERDSAGRIVAVVAPDGRRVEYTYTSEGDLATVTDVAQNVTQLSYLGRIPHYLDEIIDPRGVSATRMEYDDNGRLIAVIDANGNRVEYTHDISGRTEIVRDTRGFDTIYVYDDEGRVTAETNSLGEVTVRSYNEVGDVLSETNHLGETTSWTYDDRGNQVSETNALGEVTKYSYSAKGELLGEVSPLGYTVMTNNFSHRSLKLLSSTDALGNTTSFHWDVGVGDPSICGTGESRGYTDSLGNTHSNQLICFGPKAGLPSKETDSEGNVTHYSYDDSRRKVAEVTTRTDASGNTVELRTAYEYDAKDRVIAVTHPDGSVTQTEYNSIAQVAAEVDAAGRRTEYEYDNRGNEIAVRYPDGTQSSKTYDTAGNVLTETDRNGDITTFEYDALNRLVATQYSDGTTTSVEYDAAGRVGAEIDARGLRTEYEYDAAGRRILVRDAEFNETHYRYDAGGRLVEMIDALGHSTEYVYNKLDQRVQSIFHNGSSTSEAFDALSRRISSTDQAALSTAFAYDSLGRLISVTDSLGQITQYAYDAQGNKTAQTDAAGRTTTWSYDKVGRVVERTLPLGQSESFTYDATGNVATHTDFNGQTTTYSYDINNRVVSQVYDDGREEQFSYDANGNRTQSVQIEIGGSERITSYAYDARGRLVEEVQPSGDRLSYVYDANGNRTQVTLTRINGSVVVTDYTYDALNRLVTVTDIDGITSYGYDAVGNRTSISYPNGTSQVYRYDALNRLTTLETFNAAGALVQSYDYTLHPTGRRTGIAELSGRTTTYGYDDIYRLTSEAVTDPVNGDYNAIFTYDPVGNRTGKTVDGVLTTYSYDANDRLLQAGDTIYTYDDNGSTLTETADGATISYAYNAKNQLVELSNAGMTTSYRYNVDGIRTGQSSATTATSYVVDSNRDYAQVLLELTGAGEVRYSYGDDLISQARNGATYYYHYDGLGSTRGLSDASGTITDSYDYEAFGEVLNQIGSTENSYLFAGEQFDASLNQYYLRARYYDQGTGRFTQQDTWMGRNHDPITLHKYLYANADPVTYSDPSGNMSLGSLGAAQNISGTLMNMSISAGRLLQFVEKVETVVSLYNTRSALFRAASYVRTQGFEGTLEKDRGFANALSNYEQGLSVLSQNIGKIYSGLSKSEKVREFIKSPKNDLLIYGPTPESSYPWFSVGTRMPIGSIKLGKSSRKILIELGRGAGQGGRFTGLGHTQGARKKDHTQWFRMDWHKPDGAEQWVSENYHFHLK